MHFLQNGFDSQLNIYIEIKTYFLETYVVHGTVKYRDNPAQKCHKINRRNLRSVVFTVQLGPPKGTESDNIYWFKKVNNRKLFI